MKDIDHILLIFCVYTCFSHTYIYICLYLQIVLFFTYVYTRGDNYYNIATFHPHSCASSVEFAPHFLPVKKTHPNRRSRSQMMSKPRRSGGFYGFLDYDRGWRTPGLEMSLIHPRFFCWCKRLLFWIGFAKVVGLESHDASMGLVYFSTFNRKSQSNVGKYIKICLRHTRTHTLEAIASIYGICT